MFFARQLKRIELKDENAFDCIRLSLKHFLR